MVVPKAGVTAGAYELEALASGWPAGGPGRPAPNAMPCFLSLSCTGKHLVEQVSQFGIGGACHDERRKAREAVESTLMLEPTEATVYAETLG